MNEILKYYITSFANRTLSIKKKGLLIEKPWALVDEDGEIQKLIFKQDKGLILSKNGKVTEGHWDYYPEAKSLLIDRGTDKLLLNEQFIDENVIILKKDGTDNDFFALSNENTIPDYNIPKYLNSLKCQEFGISQQTLLNGNTLQIYDTEGILSLAYAIGHKVEQLDDKNNPLPISEGSFMSKSKNYTFYVKNGKLSSVKENVIQKSIDGDSFEIEGGDLTDEKWNINRKMTINGMPVDKQRITSGNNTIYELKESIIINIRLLRTYAISNGSTIKIEQSGRRIRKGDKIVYSEPISPLPDGQYKIKGKLKWINVKNNSIQ